MNTMIQTSSSDDGLLLRLCPPGSLTNPDDQEKVLSWFQHLKDLNDGWKMCADILTRTQSTDDEHRFLCLQVIEDFLAKKYAKADRNDHNTIRSFVTQLVSNHTSSSNTEPVFIRNKLAQLTSLVFMADFPSRWPSFVKDVFLDQLQTGNAKLVDLFLRFLMAVDGHIADSDINRTKQEMDRNTIIKDNMREKCVVDVVNVVFQILTNSVKTDRKITCLCMCFFGAYISWIDIALVANDKVFPTIVQCMKLSSIDRPGSIDNELYEAAVDCICGLLSKKIENVATKLALIETVDKYLAENNIYTSVFAQKEIDEDLMLKLADLVNCFGTVLIECWTRASKTESNDAINCLFLIKAKIPLLLQLFSFPEHTVSVAVVEFAHQLLILTKQLSPSQQSAFKEFLKELLVGFVKQYRYPKDYEHDRQGENEAEFDEYRKDVKVLFLNIGSMDPDVTVRIVEQVATEAFNHYAERPLDVELALSLIFHVGECLSSRHTNFLSIVGTSSDTNIAAVKRMVDAAVTLGVSNSRHRAVNIMFFELVNRYEKYLASNAELTPQILSSFLDERGLRHEAGQVRSRAAYIFSKFVKSARLVLQNYVDDILASLAPLLGGAFGQLQTLSADEQTFLYEAVGYLIVAGSFTAEKKRSYMEQLLGSLWNRFNDALKLLQQLTETPTPQTKEQIDDLQRQRKAIVEYIQSIINFSSRTSKAFSAQTPMDSCLCSDVFIRLMVAYVSCLDSTKPPQLVSGVRAYLHRMVTCLNSAEFLPNLPLIIDRFLGNAELDGRLLADFVLLVQQIIVKYKNDSIPKIQPLLPAVYSSVWALLEKQQQTVESCDPNAQKELQVLRRAYFQILYTIVSSGLLELFVQGSGTQENQQRLLTSLVEGAVDSSDPTSQKACFSVFHKLIDCVMKPANNVTPSQQLPPPPWLDVYLFEQVIPACFIAPTKPGFDLSDAQYNQAFAELSMCLRRVYQFKGEAVIIYLGQQFFPASGISANVAQEFCAALSSLDVKPFTKYLKEFLTKLVASRNSS